MSASSFSNALHISMRERDWCLGLDEPGWPVEAPKGWALEGAGGAGWLRRRITPDTRRSGQSNSRRAHDAPLLACELEEAVLRFPSAPIHGLHRLHEHQYNLAEAENFHTLRVLSSPEREGPPRSLYHFTTVSTSWTSLGSITSWPPT